MYFNSLQRRETQGIQSHSNSSHKLPAQTAPKLSEIEACMRKSYADVIQLTDKPSFTQKKAHTICEAQVEMYHVCFRSCRCFLLFFGLLGNLFSFPRFFFRWNWFAILSILLFLHFCAFFEVMCGVYVIGEVDLRRKRSQKRNTLKCLVFGILTGMLNEFAR